MVIDGRDPIDARRAARAAVKAEQLRTLAAAPYVHSKLAQVDATVQDKQNITAVRFLTEEEWLARRDAQQGNSRLVTSDVSDADVIDEEEEH